MTTKTKVSALALAAANRRVKSLIGVVMLFFPASGSACARNRS
jgi:hypothetical protein